MATTSLDELVNSAAAKWGKAAVRAATADEAIDGRRAAMIFEPPDATTLADMLGWANAERLAIVTCGGRTKLMWGPAPARLDILLSTACLASPIDHIAGDLTATAPAGATLGAVNTILARERQWLPLDPPAADYATIGGIIATNDSGPRRHRYGAPRDLIIGVEMALADGRTAKAGGKVVKNVAGYDLPRVLCGSFGSLAVITKATFKLAPLPPASRTVIATASQSRPLSDLAMALADAPLTPSAIELDSAESALLIRFETTGAAADRQAIAAGELCAKRGINTRIVKDDDETALWRDHETRLSPTPQGAAVRLAVLPTQVGDVLDHVERVAEKHGIGGFIGGRASLGVLTIVIQPPERNDPKDTTETLARVIDELRQNAWARGGSVVVRSAPAAVRALVDVWGDVGDGLSAMKAVKARFDPNRILNPGRGPGGL